MKTILILMDSLNRDYLKVYNPDANTITPNIDKFAEDSLVFDKHFIGSAPCMPARRDLLTGRLNFLERNWGPVEAFDTTMTRMLKDRGVFTHIVTDHCHYMETGGENYLQEYTTWDYIRGQEYDPWISRVDTRGKNMEDHYGIVFDQYEQNRTVFHEAKDFPTPRTFDAACRWLKTNRHAENYFLTVEVFDPHEPFDTPQEYLDLYEDDYEGPRFDSSTYRKVTEPDDAIEHLRKRYQATLTMADTWFGKLIDTLKETGTYDDSLILFTTDHGHLLGEHGFTGKNYMHGFNRLSNIPLMIRMPGCSLHGKRSDALTQNIDITATILAYFRLKPADTMLGTSLLTLLNGENCRTRDVLLFGWFGGAVNIYDGTYSYFRAAKREDNKPLHVYCSMPTTLMKFIGSDVTGQIEMGRYLRYTDFPVYKIPIDFPIGHLRSREHIRESLLFNCDEDYYQTRPIDDDEIEADMIAKLVRMMEWAQAPGEQFVRIGLPSPIGSEGTLEDRGQRFHSM